jgi:hypothetical protein
MMRHCYDHTDSRRDCPTCRRRQHHGGDPDAYQRHIDEYYAGDEAAAEAAWRRAEEVGEIGAAIHMAAEEFGSISLWIKDHTGNWEHVSDGSSDKCLKTLLRLDPWTFRTRPVGYRVLSTGQRPAPDDPGERWISDNPCAASHILWERFGSSHGWSERARGALAEMKEKSNEDWRVALDLDRQKMLLTPYRSIILPVGEKPADDEQGDLCYGEVEGDDE